MGYTRIIPNQGHNPDIFKSSTTVVTETETSVAEIETQDIEIERTKVETTTSSTYTTDTLHIVPSVVSPTASHFGLFDEAVTEISIEEIETCDPKIEQNKVEAVTSMYTVNTQLTSRPLVHLTGPSLGRRDKEDKLIIGIDFGTTYTGIAYAFTSDPTEIRPIKEWEGEHAAGRNDVVKVPSLIKYTNSNSFSWGYHIDASEPGLIRGIKLSLDPGKRGEYQKTSSTLDSSNPIVQSQLTVKEETARLHKSTVDIVADYIGVVYKYAMSKIVEKGMPGYVNSLKKEFVLTVPAIWSEEAKTATLRAARKCHPDFQDLNPADLITEPEAAALCTLQAFSDKGLTEGDVFVLCDAGGGTVDLISYQIVALRPKLELKEIVAPSGGLVGSMMLNESFEKYLRNTLGEEQFKTFVESEDHEFHLAMEDFENNMKPRFSSLEDWDEKAKRFSKVRFGGVRIKDDLAKNISKNVLTVTGKTLSEIFDPLITDIEALVKKQLDLVQKKMDRSARAVFLVGGFGASPYLKKRLQKLADPVEIINPVNAWSAVVRGAVLSKIPHAIRVVACVASKSFGVRANAIFYEHEHKQDAAKHKVWDDFEGIYRIPKMSWYIMKGEDLLRDRTQSIAFYRTIPFDYSPEDLIFESELEECDADYPSQYPWTHPLRISCKVTCDFTHLSSTQLKLIVPINGLKHYSLDFDLVVATGPALRTFSVKYDGVLYNTVKVEYD